MSTAVARLTIVESKLFLRDTTSLVMGVAFPAVLLLLLGFALPGFRDVTDDLDGLRPIDIYVPIVLAMAICTTSVPAPLTRSCAPSSRAGPTGVVARRRSTPRSR